MSISPKKSFIYQKSINLTYYIIHFMLQSLLKRFDAGWSSLVARQAHNLKVVGSNPTPATSNKKKFKG